MKTKTPPDAAAAFRDLLLMPFKRDARAHGMSKIMTDSNGSHYFWYTAEDPEDVKLVTNVKVTLHMGDTSWWGLLRHREYNPVIGVSRADARRKTGVYLAHERLLWDTKTHTLMPNITVSVKANSKEHYLHGGAFEYIYLLDGQHPLVSTYMKRRT